MWPWQSTGGNTKEGSSGVGWAVLLHHVLGADSALSTATANFFTHFVTWCQSSKGNHGAPMLLKSKTFRWLLLRCATLSDEPPSLEPTYRCSAISLLELLTWLSGVINARTQPLLSSISLPANTAIIAFHMTMCELWIYGGKKPEKLNGQLDSRGTTKIDHLD